MTYRTPVARLDMLDGAALARRWQPTMRALCAQHAASLGQVDVADAPAISDMRHGVDFVAATRVVMYAGRVRNAQYRHRYPDDITIRAVVPTGARTELDKFLSGDIDAEYYLYAFVADHGCDIDAYTFVDVPALAAHLRDVGRVRLLDECRMNDDGTGLVAVNVNALPPGSFRRHGNLPAPLF